MTCEITYYRSHLLLTITNGSGDYNYSWKNTSGTVLGTEETLALSSAPIANNFSISATVNDKVSGGSVNCTATCIFSGWYSSVKTVALSTGCYPYSKDSAEANNATWARGCTKVTDQAGCAGYGSPCYRVTEYSRNLSCS